MKIVSLGEILLRLSPVTNINQANQLDMYYGGGEYNVLTALSNLGCTTTMITTLPNNQLGKRALIEMRKNNINTNNIQFNEHRLGTYYALDSNEYKSVDVIYDRKDSSFAQSKFTDYDFERSFADHDYFHVSGITAALTTETQAMTLHAIELAKSKNMIVSYDSNYRAKLWTQQQAGQFLLEVLPKIDILFAGILDLKFLLGYDVDDLETGYQQLKAQYPNLKLIASTNREIVNPCFHKLSTNIYMDNELKVSKVNEIKVIDRIGAGDYFTAGVLYSYIHNQASEQIADFALATATLKHYEKGDNFAIELNDVMNVINNNAHKIVR